MAPTARRDASYASNKLKRGNYNQPPLLSVVNGRPTRGITAKTYNENSGSDSSDDPLSTDEVHQLMTKKPEPATDDEPVSSTDDEDENRTQSPQFDDASFGLGGSERRRRRSGWSAKELETKLAQGDAEEEEQERKNGEATPNTKSGKEDDTPQTAVKLSKRSSPRKKASSASPEAKRNRNTDKLQNSKKRSNDEDGDLFAPSFGARKTRTVKHYGASFRNIHSTVPRNEHDGTSFTAPASSATASDEIAHSSQATASAAEFKDPYHFSVGDIPSSSFPTETSHGNENEIFDLDLDPDGSISPLSSVSSSVSLVLTAEEKARLNPVAPAPARCPVCNELLGEEFSSKVQLLKGRATKAQMEFCRGHRIRTAERDWVEKGYPTINWEELEKRIERHLSELEKILTLQIPSYYRRLLEKSAEENRGNLRLTAHSESLDDLSPGYYGARGSKKMWVASLYSHCLSRLGRPQGRFPRVEYILTVLCRSDAIISQFAPKFQEVALSDSLMQMAGISAYVQSVLVPELTVMLVKEDMGVNNENARQIMKQSMKMGDLLNEAPDDVVNRHGRRRSVAN